MSPRADETRNAAEPSRAAEATPAPVLEGYQRRALRGLANPLRAIVQVGDAGLSQAVLSSIDEALLAHELVKIRLRAPADKKATAQAIASACGAALCGLVGHTLILYRPNPENPRIDLPRR
jgi:RNA-binding protein